MASPYILNNTDLDYLNCAGQRFNLFVAFLNPISLTTTWADLTVDNQGNWQAPPNVDTAAMRIQPYAPTANMGSNRIGFVNEPLYFDGTRSCQRFDVPAVSYVWSVVGTVYITYYANGAQCAMVFPTPGIYTIALQVTDRAGTVTQGVRQVMIYQDRESALPGVITLSGLSGSLSNGGWSCQVTTVNSQTTLHNPDALPPGTYQPIVVMCETDYELQPGAWFSRTIGPFGQFNPGSPYQDPRILFDGYVQNGTVHQDVDKDTLTFTCQGPQMILQEAKTHTIGYYNTTYTSIVNGVPVSCNPSPNGQGFLVGGLMTADVIHSLLQYHCTLMTYHDLHLWNASIPTNPYLPGDPNPSYTLVYTTLSITEGTLWSNLQDICQNEWSQVYCGPSGGVYIGPQVNYRGSDYWSQPTLLGATEVGTFLNYVQDLGYDPGVQGDGNNNISTSLPTVLPAQQMPLTFVHPWSNQPGVPQYYRPFQGYPDQTTLSTQSGLVGPPVLCLFSDVPIYDSSSTPPGGVQPPTALSWPQNIAIFPITFDFPEQYTNRAALVKLIGTLFPSTALWTSWYPQSSFSVTPTTGQNLVAAVLPAGDWVIDEQHLLPDVTTNANKLLMSNWWWEIARRVYYARNINYTGTVTLGMFMACGLSDIVAVTRQNNTLGPSWTQKLFYVTDITYSIDLTARTWTTTVGISEVTSILLGPIQPPPTILPT